MSFEHWQLVLTPNKTIMLNVQVVTTQNALIGEKVASARLVNLQSLSFDQFCEYVAEGSTVTAADVSAVMKRLETVLPLVLCLNAKVQASPYGLTFRPAVKGSITQSELKKKLEVKKADLLKSGDVEGAAKIDVNRELKPGDLTTSDMTPYIEVSMPARWDTSFQQVAEFKRVTSPNGGQQTTDNQSPDGGQQTSSGGNTTPGGDTGGTSGTGGNTTPGGNTTGGQQGGGNPQGGSPSDDEEDDGVL